MKSSLPRKGGHNPNHHRQHNTQFPWTCSLGSRTTRKRPKPLKHERYLSGGHRVLAGNKQNPPNRSKHSWGKSIPQLQKHILHYILRHRGTCLEAQRELRAVQKNCNDDDDGFKAPSRRSGRCKNNMKQAPPSERAHTHTPNTPHSHCRRCRALALTPPRGRQCSGTRHLFWRRSHKGGERYAAGWRGSGERRPRRDGIYGERWLELVAVWHWVGPFLGPSCGTLNGVLCGSLIIFNFFNFFLETRACGCLGGSQVGVGDWDCSLKCWTKWIGSDLIRRILSAPFDDSNSALPCAIYI